jgi:ribonuclease P protein component
VLPKAHRLTRPVDFGRAYSEGQSWSNRWLVLYRVPNGLACSRFGFSVSRRIGSAVVRNRVKRRVREVVRSLCDLVRPGWDLVFIARHALVEAENEALLRAVRGLLRQAGLSEVC